VNHDHYAAFRIDMDVDGAANSFVKDSLKTEQFTEGDRKSVWRVKRQVISRELDARTRIDMEKPSNWLFVNPNKRTSLGNNVAYALRPGSNVRSQMAANDPIQRRGSFTDYHLWVTPYKRDEKWGSGNYPNQNPVAGGLPQFTLDNESIENADVVAWYVFGYHHVPRQEDFPIMPNAVVTFSLIPFNFFDRNPAADLEA